MYFAGQSVIVRTPTHWLRVDGDGESRPLLVNDAALDVPMEPKDLCDATVMAPPCRPLLFDGDDLLVTVDSSVGLFDVKNEALRWTRQPTEREDGSYLSPKVRLATSGLEHIVLVLQTIIPLPDDLAIIESRLRSDGSLVWSQELPPLNGVLVVGSSVLAMQRDATVQALRSADGAKDRTLGAKARFTEVFRPALSIDDRLLIQRSGYMRRIDLLSGEELWSSSGFALTEHRPFAAAENAIVIPSWTKRRIDDRLPGAWLTVVDPATGDTRWKSSPIPTPFYRSPPPIIVGNAAFVCLGDGNLRAFDLETGDELWSWGLGMCQPFVVQERSGRGPRVIAAAANGEVWVFETSEAPAPTHRIKVAVVLDEPPDATVEATVGDRWAEVPKSGRVEVELEARGLVQVALADGRKRWVEVTGDGDYEVVFEPVEASAPD